VGTFGAWAPIGLVYLFKGAVWKGVFILVWGAVVVVGAIDTLVRPYLMGRGGHIPLVFLFFALLGGIEVFGAKGIVIGPLLVEITPVLLDIYRDGLLLAHNR